MVTRHRRAFVATRVVFACLVGVVVVHRGLVPAGAAGAPDQSSPSFAEGCPFGAFSSTLPATGTLAQTFTAGMTGDLDQVDVRVAQFVGAVGPGDLTVQIQATSGGAPSGGVVAAATIPAGTVPTASTWISVPLNPPGSVVAGTQYAIVLDFPGSSAFTADGAYTWFGCTGDPYPSGTAMSLAGSVWVDILPGEGADFAFKTYVSHNAAPVVTAITSPAADALFAAGTSVSLTATFTDANTDDTHTCTVDWDDGAGAISGVVTETSGAGTCSSSTTFTTPGVYTIAVAVSDDEGDSDTATVTIVVYDPTAGFVTGAGWINSPAGAHVADPASSGRANFGFVSKYKRGASIPDGETEFQFQAGNLNFHSTASQWLVVNRAGSSAQFKGTGTMNGVGRYGFMLWATDANPDTFRIQIWDINNGDALVYDCGVQDVKGGSIMLRTKE